MILYIHFGIYKAGSSYLQYILANSRDYLMEKGVFFPFSVNDPKMRQGLISAGNADGLEAAVIHKDDKQLGQILGQWISESKEKDCDKVLISAEALVHQLAKKDRLEFLIQGAERLGYSEIHVMGFFRDLVGHAISTYKHRAKSGGIPDYEHWIGEVYETPALLEHLVERRSEDHRLIWAFRKFYKDGNVLKKVFFRDWLQIEIPEFSGRPTVNESITLSEVMFMNEINKYYPNVTDYFVHDLKSLPSEQKEVDSDVESYFRTVFFNCLESYQYVLDKFNNFLPTGENLCIREDEVSAISNFAESPGIRLNKNQVHVILKRINFFNTVAGKAILGRRKIIDLLPQNLRNSLIKNRTGR